MGTQMEQALPYSELWRLDDGYLLIYYSIYFCMSEILHHMKLKNAKNTHTKKTIHHCQSEKRTPNWNDHRTLFCTVFGIRIIAAHTISPGLR